MRSLTALLLFLLVPLAVQAQRPPARGAGAGVVQGRVVGEAGQPLASVSVAVRSIADSSVVAGEITNAAGRFRVAGLRPGRYLVQATSLGYTPFSRTVQITGASPAVDLETVTLAVEAISLEGVSIRAERSAVAIAPDRTAYSTRDMPVAAGGVATDVLQSVPELEVDIEGAVSLRGTSAQIYLNGRPAPMEGEALNQFLQQFPAERIDRVEVIPNPSARFEAEGAGGIVNIVLKENTNLGLSGSVFTNASTRGSYGGGARVAYQRGRLTLFGGGFLRLSQRDQTSYDLRTNLLTLPVTQLEQDASSERSGSFGNVDLTADFKLTERASLWSEIGFRRNGNESVGLSSYLLSTESGGVLLERYDRATEGDSKGLSTDFSAGYRYILEPQRHEITSEIRYDAGNDDEFEVIRMQPFEVVEDGVELVDEFTHDITDQREKELSAELEYVRPWGEKGQIEAGYRGEIEDTDSDRRLESFLGQPGTDPLGLLRTGYQFRETFNSAFLTLTRKVGDFGVQLGGRAELADTRFTVPSTGEVFEKDYASLFPSANVTYEFSEARQLRFSYSRRIRRPSPRVMNPINESSDPLNRRVGNPDIDPQYTNSFSIESSWVGELGTLRFSPYYRQTVDDWTEIKTVDAQGVSTVSWENLASIDSYGTTLTGSLRPLSGWSGFASVSANREVRDASNLSRDFSGSALRWSARGNVNGRITPSLSLQGMLFYTPARDVPQGRISSRIMTHFGVRQELGERASVRLSLTDPFDLSRSTFTTSDPTHVQTGRSSWRARSGVLSFSYTFGRPPREARVDEEQGAEAEGEQRIR